MDILEEIRQTKANREKYLCSFDEETWVCRFNNPPQDVKDVFVSIPHNLANTLYTITNALDRKTLSYYVMERTHSTAQQLICLACRYISHSKAVVVEASENNTNIGLEMGMAHARGKPVIVLTKSGAETASMVKGLHWVQYDDTELEELGRKLEQALDSLRIRSVSEEG
jgi:hypothetical protein